MSNTILREFRRFFTIQSAITPKICVVGAGPAGFYATQQLIKHLPNAQVDLYERLPVPFGLVRFGVAPDHPEVKNVINTFTKTGEHKNVRFIGNVNLGADLSLKELKEAYHIILLTYGADENRKLHIPGEDLENVLSARSVVGWYNGTPWDKDLKIDLSEANVAVIGQGNVAIDVARILLTPIDQLKTTDITQHALEQLSASKVKNVYLIGRRGPLQAAFTIKELREMLKLENCKTCWKAEDFNGIEATVPTLARPKKRITELMLKSLHDESQNGGNKFEVMFHKSPLSFKGEKRVERINLGVNVLRGDDILTQRAVLTNHKHELACNLAITSIGYKSVCADHELPFDDAKGIVKNDYFKVGEAVYASGWLATGPTGVILTTMNNAFATAECIIKDIEKDSLIREAKGGFELIAKLLNKRNVHVVDWDGWKKIDAYECDMGKVLGKPREKLLDINKMLEIAK